MAALVIADAADQRHFVSQLMGVGGKVERSAAQVFGLADDVPQDLPNADDAHAQSSSYIVSCRVKRRRSSRKGLVPIRSESEVAKATIALQSAGFPL